MRRTKGTTRTLGLRLLIPLVCAALVLPASGLAVKRGAEVIDSGGGPAADGTVRLYDAIGQICGPAMSNGSDMHGYDGFLLCLPSINVPVEGTFYASLTEEGTATIRWSLAVLDGIEALRLYRATAEEGPYSCVHTEPLLPTAIGSYEDDTLWPATTFWYELRARFSDGTEDVVGVTRASVTTGGTLAFAMRAPSPNPSFGDVGLSFDIPREAGEVTLAIYNVRGQLVRKLVEEPMEPGRHTLTWDARDHRGAPVSSGVYFMRLTTSFDSAAKKLIILR
jgi:hypothetical protein